MLETTRRDWIRCLKNNNVDVEDKECYGAPNKFQDENLKVTS